MKRNRISEEILTQAQFEPWIQHRVAKLKRARKWSKEQ